MVKGRSAQSSAAIPFTRKEFYDLAVRCRDYATELAAFDPQRVNLKQCYQFNEWLRGLRRYERLGPRLASLRPARPVTRWQVAILAGIVGLLVYFFLLERGERLSPLLVLNGVILLFLTLYMMPERIVGTTVEEIEGRVLRVVKVLEAMLAEGEPAFTEAAYFQVKTNLEAAARELRQQLDLAHRQ